MTHQEAKLIFERTLRDAAKTGKPLFGIDITFDNVDYEPTAGKTYIQTHLLPVDTFTATLDGSDHTGLKGIFQMKIVGSSGTGNGEAAAIATQLKVLFRTDTLFTSGKDWVQVITPLKVNEGRSQDGNWSVPTHFEYRADTSNY